MSLGISLGISLGVGASVGISLGVGASVGPVVLTGNDDVLPAFWPQAAAMVSVSVAPRIRRILFKAQSSLVPQ